MRHRRARSILGKRTEQRIAMLKNLTKSLLIHQRIKTTLVRAKATQGEVEKLITLAKEDSLHHRRLAHSLLQDHQLVSELFKEIAPLFKARNGGYTRIIRLNHRAGDNAEMVLIELVEQKVKPVAPAKPVKEKKKVEEKAEKPKEEAKPKAEKVEKPKEEHKPKEEPKRKEEPKAEKPKEEVKPKKEEEPKKKEEPKEKKPKGGFLSGFKKLFKGKEK